MQDKFLNNLVANKTAVAVFTVNGFCLNGTIVEHDNYAVIIREGGVDKMVYKTAISTIAPKKG